MSNVTNCFGVLRRHGDDNISITDKFQPRLHSVEIPADAPSVGMTRPTPASRGWLPSNQSNGNTLKALSPAANYTSWLETYWYYWVCRTGWQRQNKRLLSG